MAVTPVRPSPERLEQLRKLAAWHHEWALRKLHGAPFDPSGRKPGSDYNQHYVDLESDDDEFHAKAREIMGLGQSAEVGKVDEGAAGDYRARHLIRWFEHGEGAARIAWGTPGDFDRCVAIAAEHMTPEQAKGFCNLRHHGALGIYPATHAAMERGHGV